VTIKRVLLSWSSGKDSAWTLHTLRRDPDVEVVGLLTSFNADADRVAMHAVRRSLVRQQAEAAQLPLYSVDLPYPCPNDAYEAAMAATLTELRRKFDVVAFGDLFLEDIRAYREAQMSKLDITPIFPLWQLETAQLARNMVADGLSAVLTCVDPKQCPAEFAGRRFDDELIDELPEQIDRCGENGEFHTLTTHGPMFEHPIDVRIGERVTRDGFVFADVLPEDN
jgi:uncharacterized protein (TIGR00290 family)